jgi:hypothetical protein
VDPIEIQKLVFDLVTSAKQEILMLLFPDTTIGNVFARVEEWRVYKITQLLGAAVQKSKELKFLSFAIVANTQVLRYVCQSKRKERRS